MSFCLNISFSFAPDGRTTVESPETWGTCLCHLLEDLYFLPFLDPPPVRGSSDYLFLYWNLLGCFKFFHVKVVSSISVSASWAMLPQPNLLGLTSSDPAVESSLSGFSPSISVLKLLLQVSARHQQFICI